MNLAKVLITTLVTGMISFIPAQAAQNDLPGTVIIMSEDGKTKQQFVSSETLGQDFKKLKLDITSYRTEDDTAINSEETLKPNQKLIVFEKNVSSTFDKIELDFVTEEIPDDSLFVGEKETVQKGVKGLAVKTTVLTKNRTSETSETTITVIEQPISQIIHIGTKEATIETLPKTWKAGDGQLAETSQKLRAVLFNEFPELTTIGGYRACDTTGEHCTGRALDIMIPNYKNNQEFGNEIKEWIIEKSDAGVIDTCWLIWDQAMFSAPNWNKVNMKDRGGDTANHFDHIHLFLKDENGGCSRAGR